MPVADDKTRVTLVVPQWMDDVVSEAANQLGISKSRFVYLALVKAWAEAGLGFEPANGDSSLFEWAHNCKQEIVLMDNEVRIRELDETRQAELMERLLKRGGGRGGAR